ncbi:uncharacterized protein PG998_000206 [Apiospora kogelbergensis]|uniref:uncharacterized protein n=1 Tax=Apiospora kogelbergensis TaxID=1337665 RepID=UPI003131710E
MQLLSPQSFGRILAALLLAPSAINLCLAAPQPLGTVEGSAALAAREDTSKLKDFKKEMDKTDVKVTQDKTDFVDLSSNKQKSISSRGFNQCFGIVLATKKGAAVGHYTCGATGKANAKRDLGAFWDKHKGDKLKDPKVYIYAKVKVDDDHKIQEGTFENANDLDAFKKILKDDLHISQTPEVVKYIDVEAVVVDKGKERDGFDQKTADAYSHYAGFYVKKGLLGGLEVKFMTLDMQKDSYKKK